MNPGTSCARRRWAKLIELADRGQRLLADAGERVADIEARWSELVGTGDFAHLCDTMQRLLDSLDPDEARR
ncbi:hypothetical protein LAUMK13_02051 [Mycobacterium innocens]|uniref:HTH marR-type domain-containing protein n=1 Tax=Mycobacterium innocens TaxID=2341083 RepID=A0A498Q393_9MYCO|nr:hypothetical protein LAUMK13_02051 [Mycobacterium innocens]